MNTVPKHLRAKIINLNIQKLAEFEDEMTAYFSGPQGPWLPEFAWVPRRIKGRWHWLTTVYRREKNRIVYPHQGYEYGDCFDALKDAR